MESAFSTPEAYRTSRFGPGTSCPLAGSTSRRLIEAAFLRAGLRLEIAMEAGGWMSMGW